MKTFALAATLIACALPAFAFHCPKDMKAIDTALEAKPALSEKELAQVKQYRAEGEKLHKEGKHQESIDTLARAMKILKIDAAKN